MDNFEVRDELAADHRAFNSFFESGDARIRKLQAERHGDRSQRPQPWLSLSLGFESGDSVAELVPEAVSNIEQRGRRGDTDV